MPHKCTVFTEATQQKVINTTHNTEKRGIHYISIHMQNEMVRKAKPTVRESMVQCANVHSTRKIHHATIIDKCYHTVAHKS